MVESEAILVRFWVGDMSRQVANRTYALAAQLRIFLISTNPVGGYEGGMASERFCGVCWASERFCGASERFCVGSVVGAI